MAIQIEAQITLEELLRAVSQLSSPDLDEFIQRALLLQAKRRTPAHPEPEAELLVKINQSLPDQLWQRYHRLVAQRQAESLTPDEHAELVQLSDQIDALHTDRMEALARLAQLRKRSLRELMDEFGIRPAPCG